MQYKLEYKDANPKFVYVRLLDDPHFNTLLLIGELKLTNNSDGEIDTDSIIHDFTFKIIESDFEYDELQLSELTECLSEVLNDIIST